LQVVDVSCCPALASALEVHEQNLRSLGTVIGEGQRDAPGCRSLVPDLLEKRRVVGQYDRLGAVPRHFCDLVNRLAPAEGVLAAKGIVEYDNLVSQGLVLFQVSEEECEGEGRPVAGAERILETRPVGRRAAVAKIDGRIVDDKPVA
jgi:hypothetical protein